MERCSEEHYIWLIFKIDMVLVIVGASMYFIKPLNMLLPIYESASFWKIKSQDGYGTSKYELTVNQLSFQVVNWIEIVVIYLHFKRLKKVQHD